MGGYMLVVASNRDVFPTFLLRRLIRPATVQFGDHLLL